MFEPCGRPQVRKPKFEAEIKAARKKLAELEKLENSKVVLPLAEIQKPELGQERPVPPEQGPAPVELQKPEPGQEQIAAPERPAPAELRKPASRQERLVPPKQRPALAELERPAPPKLGPTPTELRRPEPRPPERRELPAGSRAPAVPASARRRPRPTPAELQRLVDAAHGLGLKVLFEVVQAHASANRSEGLGAFDGAGLCGGGGGGGA